MSAASAPEPRTWPDIVGLAKAAELAMEIAGEMGRWGGLRLCATGWKPAFCDSPARASTGDGPVPRVANTTNICFDQLEGEALVIALDLKGVAVSGGSACHSGATEPSHVLMAMGLDKNTARASLRFSLLKTATDADVDDVLSVVPEAVEHLRALSPVAAGTLG